MSAAYFAHFDSQTNGGRVLTLDLSTIADLPQSALTRDEVTERSAWGTTSDGIRVHYESISGPKAKTREDVLQQRIMPPFLSPDVVSSRSAPGEARRRRRYPPTIAAWTTFATEVAAFQPTPATVPGTRYTVFEYSLELSDPSNHVDNERTEESFLLQMLSYSLVRSKMVAAIRTRGGVGRMDALLLKTIIAPGTLPLSADISVSCEFKSTHNLPLPIQAANIATAYNNGYDAVITNRAGRTDEWGRVCHPISQIVGYMVENSCRYGALSSGTRTYFLCIEGDGDEASVKISNAMFVGERDYLRAWVRVHTLGTRQANLDKTQLQWKMTSSKKRTPPKRRIRPIIDRVAKIRNHLGRGQSRGGAAGGAAASGADTVDEAIAGCGALEEVASDEIEILSSLGDGRNGGTFLANWRGQNVALKQYDTSKGGDAPFNKELEAYLRMEDSWGELIVKPLFVASSWSGLVMFLGLQLGRDPTPTDDLSGWKDVLNALEARHGFRHNDADRRNMLFIPADGNTGREKLVAIDLEDYSMDGTVS